MRGRAVWRGWDAIRPGNLEESGPVKDHNVTRNVCVSAGRACSCTDTSTSSTGILTSVLCNSNLVRKKCKVSLKRFRLIRLQSDMCDSLIHSLHHSLIHSLHHSLILSLTHSSSLSYTLSLPLSYNLSSPLSYTLFTTLLHTLFTTLIYSLFTTLFTTLLYSLFTTLSYTLFTTLLHSLHHSLIHSLHHSLIHSSPHPPPPDTCVHSTAPSAF